MCSTQYTFCTPEATKTVHENNIQLVYVTCSISKGQALGKTLCAITNSPEQPSQLLTYNIVKKTVKECAMNSVFCAVKEAVKYKEGSAHLTIALDGTWQQWGLYIICSQWRYREYDRCWNTYRVLPRVWKCERKYRILCQHKTNDTCKKNYSNEIGGLEAAGAISTSAISVKSRCKIQYDDRGDSKAW